TKQNHFKISRDKIFPNTTDVEPTTVCHVVAMPYPGRSHSNALMYVCKRLASRKSDILITFVVTEEWLGLIGSDPKPDNIRFRTVPNVIPSEHGRAKGLPCFMEAVWTKLRGPFEELLDGVVHEAPVSAIAADSLLVWATKAGNRRNIPVASFWPLSASLFSVFYHFDLIKQNGHYPFQQSGS
ncbi:UDP-glucuronosyl/UDP-glucosyltransferase, partial [Parasponia andersonii]